MFNKLFSSAKPTDPEWKSVYKDNLYKLLQELIGSQQLIKASQVLKTEKQRDPSDPKLKALELQLARENFRVNYYGTRVNVRVEGGAKPGSILSEYTWNGTVKPCYEGFVPDSIQQKVEDRINYFRVNAGAPPIYLDSQLSNWCQKAALVMEAQNKLNHELPNIWPCYSDEAAEAAKYSLLTQNATTTLAVTSFMADQTHPTLGNRRWMLYPYSMIWGHGSSRTKCVLWALDDSRSKDSVFYKTNYIAWPYPGYVHKMFLFKKWSFTILEDLTAATVTMTLNKAPVKLTLEKIATGYGLPTLVWTPELDASKLKEGDKIDVVVKCGPGKTYSYTVKLFDYKP